MSRKKPTVVADAEDLLRRLKLEQRRGTPEPEAEVAFEFSKRAPRLLRELLTLVERGDRAG